MVYDGFQAKDLAEACAEFTLWHHEAFARRRLGGIRLSLGTGEEEEEEEGTPSPSGCPRCPRSGLTGCSLRREQLRAARGLDGLDRGGAAGVEAAPAAARALGGGSAPPQDQPGPPGVAPEPPGSGCCRRDWGIGAWNGHLGHPCAGWGLCPPLPAAMKWHQRAHLAALDCCGHIWRPFIALGTVPRLLLPPWGWSCCLPLLPVWGCALHQRPSSPWSGSPGAPVALAQLWVGTRMSLFLLGCPVPLEPPRWFPFPGHWEDWSHSGPPRGQERPNPQRVFCNQNLPGQHPLLGLRGDRRRVTMTRTLGITGKSFIGFCPPCSSSGSARCGVGASKGLPTAPHGHVSSDSWMPWVPGKRRVGTQVEFRAGWAPSAHLHPLEHPWAPRWGQGCVTVTCPTPASPALHSRGVGGTVRPWAG